MNSLNLSDLQISASYSSYYDTTLCGHDQNGRKINVLHVCVNEKLEPSITDWSPGKSYLLSECNLYLRVDFKTLLDKNLILLHTDKMEMIAFSGFEKYGKISKHSKFGGPKIHGKSSERTNRIYLNSFIMLDKKASACVKKTLMDIAWWFDRVPNGSQRQYELIPKNIEPNQIQQYAQPTFTKSTTSTPISSQMKTPPSIPTKPSTNTNSSSAMSNSAVKPSPILMSSTTITNSTPSSFKSLADFQGNNFDKDIKISAQQHLKTAIELAKEEGFTKFAISNSIERNFAPEMYFDNITEAPYHRVKIDFFIDASNGFGKNCQLILQRQFFVSSPNPKEVLRAIAEIADKIQKSVSIIDSIQV